MWMLAILIAVKSLGRMIFRRTAVDYAPAVLAGHLG
jgi:hypothetical protein